jgi:CubicO group peptidase (beta-lactamase class C family)
MRKPRPSLQHSIVFLGSLLPTLVFSNPIDSVLDRLMKDGQIVGAQVYIGEDDITVFERNYGIRSIDDKTPINSETLFCIGSCSKPYASAVILSLVETGELDLRSPISGILPAFSNPKIARTGKPTRPPNLLELLSHRGGIYSQKRGMNRRQARWIRDFGVSLTESVNGISKEPLLAEPGTKYAYSGAGYCILGRVAETQTGNSFEQILQERIGQPLAFRRTTYFPQSGDRNIASGSLNQGINPATPHLSKPFRLPLIGGSLYSTVRDSSRLEYSRGEWKSDRNLSHRLPCLEPGEHAHQPRQWPLRTLFLHTRQPRSIPRNHAAPESSSDSGGAAIKRWKVGGADRLDPPVLHRWRTEPFLPTNRCIKIPEQAPRHYR